MNSEGGEPTCALVASPGASPSGEPSGEPASPLEPQPALRGRPHTAHHAHITPTGPEDGDCKLRDGDSGSNHSWMHTADLPRVASPRLDRLAHLTPFGRYMKAQPRLAGDRRKPCRHGSGSDIPMECVTLLGQCVGLTDKTCDCCQFHDRYSWETEDGCDPIFAPPQGLSSSS